MRSIATDFRMDTGDPTRDLELIAAAGFSHVEPLIAEARVALSISRRSPCLFVARSLQ